MEPIGIEPTTSCMPSSNPEDKGTPEGLQNHSNDAVTGVQQGIDSEHTESQDSKESGRK